MSDKNIDWLRRLQLLEKALKENRVNNSVCVDLDAKISGYELDFSEHDKAFEDKIAKREEAIGYYKDSFYRAEKNCDKLYHENKELKQRIAELESRETKKPKNGWICVVAKEINGKEYVTLDDFMRVVNDLQEQNRLEDDGK